MSTRYAPGERIFQACSYPSESNAKWAIKLIGNSALTSSLRFSNHRRIILAFSFFFQIHIGTVPVPTCRDKTRSIITQKTQFRKTPFLEPCGQSDQIIPRHSSICPNVYTYTCFHLSSILHPSIRQGQMQQQLRI